MRKFTLILVALLSAVTLSATNKERVIFLGEHTMGSWVWDDRMEFSAVMFSSLSSGDIITMELVEDIAAATAANEIYYQYEVNIASATPEQIAYEGLAAETSQITISPTDEQISQIKASGLRITGHFIKVKQVMYGQTNLVRQDVSIVSNSGDLPFDTQEWNVSLGVSLDILRTAKAGDKIIFDIKSTYTTTDRDYCQAYVQMNDHSIGSDDLKDNTRKEYTLTDDDITAIASASWVQFVGKGVVVNNVYLNTEVVSHDYIYSFNASAFDFPSSLNGQTINVELYRKFDWNSTICLPFDLADLSAFPTGVKVYEFNKYDNGLVFVEREHIEAGVPYFMTRPYDANITEDGKYSTISFEDVTINTTLNNSEESNGLTFKGNYTVGMNMEGKYGVAYSSGSWGFFKGGATSTLNAFSAYFEGSIPGSAQLGIILEDDETTGINNIEEQGARSKEQEGTYNLAGQKVSDSYKGIVIKNGKKVIVK